MVISHSYVSLPEGNGVFLMFAGFKSSMFVGWITTISAGWITHFVLAKSQVIDG